MLKPAICLICEKVIIDQQIGLPRLPGAVPSSGPASLIGLFTKVYFSIPPGAPEIPANAVAPKEWAIYSEWDSEPGDEKRNYFLGAQIYYPNGEPFGLPIKVRINIVLGQRAQVFIRVPGFPIGQAGTYTIQVWAEADEERIGNPVNLTVEVIIFKQENPAVQ